MEVEVRLFAGFRAGRFRNRRIELPIGASVGDVLNMLEIPHEHVPLPLVNGRHAAADEVLANDDVLSVFPAIGGG